MVFGGSSWVFAGPHHVYMAVYWTADIHLHFFWLPPGVRLVEKRKNTLSARGYIFLGTYARAPHIESFGLHRGGEKRFGKAVSYQHTLVLNVFNPLVFNVFRAVRCGTEP